MEGTPGHRRGHAGTGEDARGPGVPSPRGDNPPSPTAPGDTGSAVSLASPRDPPGDTEPDGDKVCAVCGDRASGYHFHVMSCEGCKGFFRRSIIKGVRFTCPLARRCPVTKAKRRQCQACRLQKCLDVGMRKDMIMSEEALRRRRELRGQRGQPGGQRGQQGQAGGQQGLTAEQQELIALLIAAHQRTFDSSFSQFSSYWPAVRLLVPSPRGSAVAAEMSLSPREEEPPDAPSLLPQFADLSTFMIQQVIKFAKEIPVFRSLPLEAQISLLKGATLGICQIRFNTVFNPATKAWECGQRCYTIRDGALGVLRCAQVYLGVPQMFPGVLRCAPGVPRCAPVCPGVFRCAPGVLRCAQGAQVCPRCSPDVPHLCPRCAPGVPRHVQLCPRCAPGVRRCAPAGFQQIYLEPLLKFHESLRRLRLHEAEYALLQAMLLFSPDHAGIAQRDVIDQFQEKVAVTLQSYIEHQHPRREDRFLYAKLLLLLTELQTLKAENTRQILHIHDLSAMTPLLSEIIS
ncbi:nuclear receptor subfamily 1 group I member 3 isoform X3 [Chamaea fasciata]|uniref:nuclear receptor subfamily 1 group I member 3 isoform X3 n=1 Tax=Chamaea fasciata TaxID=190680 RepID=UPI00336A17A2